MGAPVIDLQSNQPCAVVELNPGLLQLLTLLEVEISQ